MLTNASVVREMYYVGVSDKIIKIIGLAIKFPQFIKKTTSIE